MIAISRAAHRLAFVALRMWWFLARPTTRGVKLIVRSGDDILFVRHTYGDRRSWEIPGGGQKRREAPEQAAHREALEELGLRLTGWQLFGTVVWREHATAELSCLVARHDGRALRLSLGEIAEARWCPPADPPRPLGPLSAEILRLPELAGAMLGA